MVAGCEGRGSLAAYISRLRDALRKHNEDLQRAVAEYSFVLDDIVKPAA
jgi:hypothetical protein